ncbi:MAG: TRAP transporter small permease [Clostridiales bacterium]|nr:TRAP transporter small permease [Clostridiales bacterium]
MGIVKKLIDNIEEIIVAPLVAIMTIVTVLQVFFRFVIKGSLPWSEELSRYLMVWVTFVGSSIGVKRSAHAGISIVIGLLPKKVQQFAKYIRIVIVVIFCLVVMYVSFNIVQMQYLRNQISPAMRIPMWWAYAAIPVGTFLMAVRFIQSLFIKNEVVEVRD